MFVAYVVIAVLLGVLLPVSASLKFRRAPQVVETLGKVGVPDAWFPRLGALEAAGGLGLLVGIWWAPLGVAAAVGLVLYFLGAAFFHVRAKDFAGLPPAAVILVLSVVALVLRLQSA